MFIRYATLAISAISLLIGCGEKGEGGGGAVIEDSGAISSEVSPFNLQLKNELEGLPGDLYASQVDSAIHWQSWGEEAFAEASKSNRLVFGVIGMSQLPYQHDIFRQIEGDQALVNLINEMYVPILVDADVMREMALLGAYLCAEVGTPFVYPLLIWFSPEGNPVSWVPLMDSEKQTVPELVLQSHISVYGVWEDDEEYVIKHSKETQILRAKHIREVEKQIPYAENSSEDVVRALRYLVSLYDPMTRTMNDSGGLFPSGVIKMLTLGAQMNGVGEDLAKRCEEVLGFLLEDLQESAMFDPLDGGVYSSRRGNSWSLPGYFRDCATQAEIARTLLDAYEVTGDETTVARAIDVIRYCEGAYRTENGLFTLVDLYDTHIADWLWRTEDLRKLLSPDELQAWIISSGMKDEGNIPEDLDPRNEAGDLNTMRDAKDVGEVAEKLGWQKERVEALLMAAKEKVLIARNERLNRYSGELRSAHAISTFRMVSAYCAAFRATGEAKWLDEAIALSDRAKEAFSDGPRLMSYAEAVPKDLYTGRAFVYGVALNAVLDVAASTLDQKWDLWAADIATTATENFLVDGSFTEVAGGASVLDVRMADMTMLYGNSSLGELSMAEARFSNGGRDFLPTFAEKLRVLPLRAKEMPVIHSDLISAGLVRAFGAKMIYDADLNEEQRDIVSRLPADGIAKVSLKQATLEERKLFDGDLLLLGHDGNRLLFDETGSNDEEPLPNPAD